MACQLNDAAIGMTRRRMMSEKKDPGFVADVIASGNEAAKRLLRMLGMIEMSEVCEHDWHKDGSVNGVAIWHCQKCGKTR
jgi:hypothetical protein